MSVLVFLFVMELLLLSPPLASCLLTEQKLHKGLGDSSSDAVQHPLNYGSHRAGNARLMGYQAQHCGREIAVCYNPPPWINIQQGLSHFAHLFVATQWGLHFYRWMKMFSYLQGEQQTCSWISNYELTFAFIHTVSLYFII